MMILLFKDMINLINLGMPVTNSEVAGPPQEWGCGGLINFTNKKKHFLKYEEHEHTVWALLGSGLKILCVVFLSLRLGEEAAGNAAERDCISPGDS